MAKVFAGTSLKMARLAGNKTPVLLEAGEEVKVKAEAIAAAHAKTGDFSGAYKVRRVKGRSGVKDVIVENTHEAAFDIEMGHWARSRDGEPSGKWVEGLHTLHRALGV